MSTILFHDFLSSWLGHVDGVEVLDHEVVGMRILTAFDPEPGTVILHGRVQQTRDANGIRNERTRFQIYGPEYNTTKNIAEVLHAAAQGSGITIPANQIYGEQAFFDHVDSEQGPSLVESPGLKSTCFQFDLTTVSRSIS